MHTKSDGTSTVADVATAINNHDYLSSSQNSNIFPYISVDAGSVDGAQQLQSGTQTQAAVYSFDLEEDTISFKASDNQNEDRQWNGV